MKPRHTETYTIDGYRTWPTWYDLTPAGKVALVLLTLAFDAMFIAAVVL